MADKKTSETGNACVLSRLSHKHDLKVGAKDTLVIEFNPPENQGIDWAQHKEVPVTVIVTGNHFDFVKGMRHVALTKGATAKALSIDVFPSHAGEGTIHVDVYVKGGLSVLEQYEVKVPVAPEEKKPFYSWVTGRDVSAIGEQTE